MEPRKRYTKEFKLDAISLVLEQEEIRRLRIENKQLKLERQILKEAAVFFAKETK
jgi:transposase-like protein